MLIVLMNDQGYGVIKNIQDAAYRWPPLLRRPAHPGLRPTVGFLGLRHAKVSDLKDFSAVLDGALAEPGPFLLEVDMLAVGSFKSIFRRPADQRCQDRQGHRLRLSPC